MAEGASEIRLAVTVNGRNEDLVVPSRLTLLELLRDRLRLRGTKLSCSRAVCGSCTVLVDGIPTASCAAFAFQVEGTSITTIEGLQRSDGELHPIQQAFIDHSAFQCGYCTSGMIMLTKALLDRTPSPGRDEVVKWLSSNICRCTGYSMIIDAVLDAAGRMREAS
jgi:aerobic carbon-monoxide dehydrogenase small subunit